MIARNVNWLLTRIVGLLGSYDRAACAIAADAFARREARACPASAATGAPRTSSLARIDLARRACGWVAVVALAAWGPGAAAMDDADAHEHHHVAPGAARTSATYAIPDVQLVREDGKTVRLSDELADGRPVVLSFVFTSCTTVCPILTGTLSRLERKLGLARDHVRLVSISIDPEYDTPARLREYASRFDAGPEWHHYTGTLAASEAVQRAFGVWRGDKMNHSPTILVRTAPGAEWVRFDGFATADQLLAELPGVHASR